MAKILVDMGWYLGINGIVTFKNAEDLREVVRWLPLEHLLLETDSPFLAPIPFRGKPNKPAHIPTIAGFIAKLRKFLWNNYLNKLQQTRNACLTLLNERCRILI